MSVSSNSVRVYEITLGHDVHISDELNEIIIMAISRCYFSSEHIALSYKKSCEHRIRKNQQIKTTVHDGRSYLK